MCSASKAGIGTIAIYLTVLKKSACDELTDKRASKESPDQAVTDTHNKMKKKLLQRRLISLYIATIKKTTHKTHKNPYAILLSSISLKSMLSNCWFASISSSVRSMLMIFLSEPLSTEIGNNFLMARLRDYSIINVMYLTMKSILIK